MYQYVYDMPILEQRERYEQEYEQEYEYDHDLYILKNLYYGTRYVIMTVILGIVIHSFRTLNMYV